jgi:phage/conjugal plasmid C-4 type zinc finger TraR family protein
LADTHQRTALAAHQRRVRPVTNSPMCHGCGEEIPQQRREILPGCCLCVECQTEFERNVR